MIGEKLNAASFAQHGRPLRTDQPPRLSGNLTAGGEASPKAAMSERAYPAPRNDLVSAPLEASDELCIVRRARRVAALNISSTIRPHHG
jgi:hypothetical protein